MLCIPSSWCGFQICVDDASRVVAMRARNTSCPTVCVSNHSTRIDWLAGFAIASSPQRIIGQ